jgi:lysophospholipase L1-like esterase
VIRTWTAALLALGALLAGGCTAPAPHASAPTPSAAPTTAQPRTAPGSAAARPGGYYLALGDSIAYGYQQSKVEAGLPPAAFRTGYVDLVAARLAALRPGVRTVNYSCPGESTASFTRGCRWRSGGGRLHADYRGSQLSAALAFLRAHPGQVNPITVSLIGNDVNALADACPGVDLTCLLGKLPAALDGYRIRLTALLAQLRAAAPDAVVVVVGSYDPLVEALPLADPVVARANAAAADAARAAGARFVDPMPMFNPAGTGERTTLCRLVAVCDRRDPHPTDAGYRGLADLVWTATDFG